MTPDQIAELAARLREAIAAGPTPGQWGANGTAVFLAGHGGFDLYHCPSPHSNAQYIAAASPDNIAALLDRLDKLAGEHAMMKSLLLSEQAEKRELSAECERLREAIAAGPTPVDARIDAEIASEGRR